MVQNKPAWKEGQELKELLYVQVAEAMKKEICGSDAPLGTPLPSERALAAQYHVSRNVVRQALSQLAEEGFIERTHGHSATIQYTCDEQIVNMMRRTLLNHQASFLDALELREVLELAIIEKVIPYLTDELLSSLQNVWDDMEDARYQLQISRFLKGDEQFHGLLAGALPNPMFHLLLQTAYSMSPMNFFEFSRTLENVLDDTQREHARILVGLKARSPELARQAMQIHMHNIRLDVAALRHKGT